MANINLNILIEPKFEKLIFDNPEIEILKRFGNYVLSEDFAGGKLCTIKGNEKIIIKILKEIKIFWHCPLLNDEFYLFTVTDESIKNLLQN